MVVFWGKVNWTFMRTEQWVRAQKIAVQHLAQSPPQTLLKPSSPCHALKTTDTARDSQRRTHSINRLSASFSHSLSSASSILLHSVPRVCER